MKNVPQLQPGFIEATADNINASFIVMLSKYCANAAETLSWAFLSVKKFGEIPLKVSKLSTVHGEKKLIKMCTWVD